MKLAFAALILAPATMFTPPTAKAGNFAHITTYACKVIRVASFANRVHVECATLPPYFFASPTSDYTESAQLRALGLEAMSSGRPLMITYDTLDDSAVAFGCAKHNCRRPLVLKAGA